jgi:hypothetical protein
MPRAPYRGFIRAWVESAPTPRRVCTHSAPTAKKRLAIATPKRPCSSRARIDQVISAPIGPPDSPDRHAILAQIRDGMLTVDCRAGSSLPRIRHAAFRRATRKPKMIKFFYNLAPNPMKVALFLEEAGLPYEPVPVDTRKGEQHLPAFTAINPNAKLPALVDGDATLFDSNAIVLYLAEKTGKLLPPDTPKPRAARCCRG